MDLYADPSIFGMAAASRGFAGRRHAAATGPGYPPEWDEDPEDDSNAAHARIDKLARLRRQGEALLAADRAGLEEQAS